MAGKLFSTKHESIYRYDKVIRHFFTLDKKAYKIIKKDIENNTDEFSKYLNKNYIHHEKHKRNFIKVASVILFSFIISLSIILLSTKIFLHYISANDAIELTKISLFSSIFLGIITIPIFYKAEKELDNIDILAENAIHSIYSRTDSILLKLEKESTYLDKYLNKMRKITIFHYYGVMLYAHKNGIRTEWHW